MQSGAADKNGDVDGTCLSKLHSIAVSVDLEQDKIQSFLIQSAWAEENKK